MNKGFHDQISLSNIGLISKVLPLVLPPYLFFLFLFVTVVWNLGSCWHSFPPFCGHQVVAHVFNPSTWEVKTGFLWVWSQLGLYSEIQDSQDHIIRQCLKKKVPSKLKAVMRPDWSMQKHHTEARKLAQWLRALAAISKDLSSLICTHIRQVTATLNSRSGTGDRHTGEANLSYTLVRTDTWSNYLNIF